MQDDVREREARMPAKGGEPVPPMQADVHSDSDPAVETAVEARQGFLDRPVLLVLVAGLALAMIGWVFAELVY
ncbi:hypothetical protein [Bosea sp. CS1GBMeth4]|uniref:hypothetical protein n=1 Tax=Bosea sp. CS1GBMeth4 TaxID=1892849 RepID=UPI00164660ED|nr:hypothetical protein [Bosea sp. CS1GBMeth4]